VTLRRRVVDHQHRRMPRPQEVLQRENLSPITQQVLRQQPHLGQRVDDDAGRVDALDLTAQQPHRPRPARLLRGGTSFADCRRPPRYRAAPARKSRCHLATSHGRPAMGDRDGCKLVEGLGHADVENLFAPVAAGQDELHAQSRLAGAYS
jgi:hypothetical protein